MRPAVAQTVRRNAVYVVGTLSGAGISVEPEPHLDPSQIRDRTPCPIMLDPI